MNIKGISPIRFGDSQPSEKKHLTDNFQTKLRNSSDMSDCITVPRTIFKGYLGIMAGTTLATLSTFMKPSKIKSAIGLTGLATSLYGTWAFVRPYILKGAVPSVDLNKSNK
jgi:hypothetical protein